MREIPECLNRRYQMLDKLIRDLSTNPLGGGGTVTPHPSVMGNEVGVKLMCDFWNILKEDPECDLQQEVQQRLCGKGGMGFRSPQHIACYRQQASKKLSKENLAKKRDGGMNRIKRICIPKDEVISKCAEICAMDGEKLPLTQVLFNIKEAASFDKKCHARVEELMTTQRELTEQIQNLEERERQGVQLLKQADCMWSCMEDSYKKKILESQERYKTLMTELKEIEGSAVKWRKHRKDLEFQLKNINQCGDDIKEKINQKNNDLKVMGMEIEEYKKRIESNAKDLNVAKNSYKSKKEASDARMEAMAAKMKKLQQRIAQENKFKNEKEIEGVNYVKEARNDLQKICKLLLQKKIENEDVLAERDALLQEIELLTQTCDSCKLRCENKEKSIAEEMARVEKELAASRAKCIKCHQNTDTIDVRKFCTDCPRCLAERDCVYAEDHCSADHSMDCVCMSVKQKFLDNVFDNMYTVLERQARTCPGKAVADCVLSCLKKSRNGKLTQDTRKILQDFILSTVKKNLNLTIVGGAVKTRCEMDPETYKQLMLCLQDIKVERPVKEEKGTGAKKAPCHRWGTTTECHCPKGPKGCVCNKAPPPPTDPHSCGMQPADEDQTPTEKTCPQRESQACSTDCGMLGMPGAPSNWQREPCAGQTCPFAKNMRAAQCVLGPESLSSVQKTHPLLPSIQKKSPQDKMATCTCGSKTVKPCPCHRDTKQLTAEVTENCPKYRKIKKDVSRQKPADFKLNSDGQKEGHKKIQRKESNISRNKHKEQFKIAIESKTGMSSNQYTELKQTKSGRLALELDEQLIDMLEKKSQEHPSLYIFIKKTTSGNLLVDFTTNENDADSTHKVTIRRTSSGTRLLDIHKNIINFLKGSVTKNSDPNTSKRIKQTSGPEGQDKAIQMITDKVKVDTSQIHDKESIFPEKNMRERKKDRKPLEDIISSATSSLKSIEELQKDHVTESTFGKTLQRTDKIDRQKLPRQESLEKFSEFDFKSQFRKLYKKGNADVAVQIKGKDGVVQTFSTVVTKTTSGTIAIYIDNMTSLKHIPYINNEYPVLLSKISSSSYFVNFEKNGRVSNAILRKTPSGGMFVIPESRSLIEMRSKSHTNDNDIKLKIMGLQPHLIELPATLQTTPSLNYLIVLDKNDKKEHIIEFMQDKKELIVDLHKTSSGNYIVDLDTEGESHLTNQKALIYKSSSDDLKVLIQKDIFESIAGLVSLESSSTDSLHVVGKFPASSREIHRGNLRKTKKSENASSNLQIHDDLKVQGKRKIFSERPAVLKKTDSGQYAVVLNKKSKKAFINNLHSFLSANSEGLIPIRRSDSGEIIIDLNSIDKSKGHYGTLKITPSGNIYVVVDEGVIKTMTDRDKNVKVMDDGVGTKSLHATDLASVNKAITTTCNGQPADCDCDATKCVCSDLRLHTFGPNKIKPSIWEKEYLYERTIHSKELSGIDESPSIDKSPHIVIKPKCDCGPESKTFGSMNQCYFLINSVCPYHQNRYESVSNEILEITGLCNTHKKPSNNKIEFEAINNLSNEGKQPQVWDSLNYLPPQLPPFLNIDYR